MPSADDMKQRLRLKLEVDRTLDDFYHEVSELGMCLGEQLSRNAGRSQIRNLQVVAASAARTSDLKNHVKNQTGKDSRRHSWRAAASSVPPDQDGCRRSSGAAASHVPPGRTDSGQTFGGRTLKLLDRLAKKSQEIVASLDHSPSDVTQRAELARQVELELQRGVVQTLACAALYGEVLEEGA